MAGFTVIAPDVVALTHDRVLIMGGELAPPLEAVAGTYSRGFRLLDYWKDPSPSFHPDAIITRNTIHYVNDIRHSHFLSAYDGTTFSGSGVTNRLALQIDYGADIAAKELYIIWSEWFTGTAGTIRIAVATSAGAETNLISMTASTTTEFIRRNYFRNLTFRYLRVYLTVPSGSTTFVKIKKVVITK
jgi:hypothetical protein